MDPFSWFAAIGENKAVEGIVALYGLWELAGAARNRFVRPDAFADVDWRTTKWTDQQSNRYFAEREAFKRRLAGGDNGLGQAFQAIALLALVMILLVSLIVVLVVPAQTSIPKPALALALILIIALTWRRFAYACRRLERYNAYRDGDPNWMYSPRLRNPKTTASIQTAEVTPDESKKKSRSLEPRSDDAG